jgi:hypothetical protein
MSKQIVDLAVEIADSRDIDLPFKLLKIKGIYSCLLSLCSDKNVIFFCNFKIFYKNLIQI